MRADGVNIALLAERLGTNDAAAIRKQHVIAKRRSVVLTIAQDSQATRDVVGRQRATGSRLTKSVFEKTRHEFYLVRVAAHGNLVTARNHMGANQVFDRAKDSVAGAQDARGVNPLGNGKSNLRGFHGPPCEHGLSRNRRLR